MLIAVIVAVLVLIVLGKRLSARRSRTVGMVDDTIVQHRAAMHVWAVHRRDPRTGRRD